MKTFLVVGCLALAPVLGFVLVRPEADGDRLEQVLGDADLDALLRMAPPLDPGLQERAWAWMVDTEGWPGGWSTNLDEDWYLAGEDRPPARRVEEHEQLRSNVERLTAMLATDRACLTSVGWLDASFARERDAFDGHHLRMPSIQVLVAAARWYAHEAMCAEDPAPALRRLEGLDRALSHPGTVIDRMCSRSVGRVRDRTCLRLLLRGAAHEPLVRAWLAEPSREIERLVEDVHADRIRYAATVGRDVERGRWSAWNADLDLADRARWWWRGAGDVASWLELCRAFEGHLQGEVAAAEVQRLEMQRLNRQGRPFASSDLHASYLEQALHADVQHRLARVAAAVLLFGREHARLPRDERQLRTWMGPRGARLDAAAFRLGLAYERLGQDSFRVHVDPDTPVPALLTSEARHRLCVQFPTLRHDAVISAPAFGYLVIRVPAP